MKIGIVCPYAINKSGGVLEVIVSIQAEMKKRGHEVKIITPLLKGVTETDIPNVIFIGGSVDYNSPMHTTVQVSATPDIEKIDAMLAAEQFDILHFHEPWQPLLSRQILQRSQSVNIATFHSSIPKTLASRTTIKAVTPYLKSVLKHLHVYTAVSPSSAEYASSMIQDPIAIIPNGIDLKKYRLKSIKPTASIAEKHILFIGRLERRKGVRYLLQAYQLLAQTNPDVHLTIAGDGPERERLELLVEDLKLPNVTFLGYVSEELKLQLLTEADLLCSPAVYGESFGIVLLEAMATGTIVVAGNNPGYSDLMQGVGALSIVDPHHVQDFASRLALMLHEPDLQKVWHAWAREYVKQFSWKTVADQYEQLYIDALEEHGQR